MSGYVTPQEFNTDYLIQRVQAHLMDASNAAHNAGLEMDRADRNTRIVRAEAELSQAHAQTAQAILDYLRTIQRVGG